MMLNEICESAGSRRLRKSRISDALVDAMVRGELVGIEDASATDAESLAG
jgi:hypothetical protein